MTAPPAAAAATTLSGRPVPAAYRQLAAAAKVVVVFNQKGGLGKTTIIMGLAAQAAETGLRTLLCDVDPQASAYSLSMSIPERLRQYMVVHDHDPANLAHLRDLGQYDRIYVDCPGSLEDRGVLRQVLAAADYALIPYDHKKLSRDPTFRTVAYAQEAGVPYRVLMNRLSSSYG